jgi:hypothetical protein
MKKFFSLLISRPLLFKVLNICDMDSIQAAVSADDGISVDERAPSLP